MKSERMEVLKAEPILKTGRISFTRLVYSQKGINRLLTTDQTRAMLFGDTRLHDHSQSSEPRRVGNPFRCTSIDSYLPMERHEREKR